MSAYSRAKGNRAEVEAVAAIRRLGYDAITSRLGRGGTQGGEDIITDLPVSIECKDQSRDALPSWLDQARAQADDCHAAVLHKRRGKARAESWFVTMQFDDFVALIKSLEGGS